MRWVLAIGIVLIIVALMLDGSTKQSVNNTPERMKKLRAIKAKKARERADAQRAQMKVA